MFPEPQQADFLTPAPAAERKESLAAAEGGTDGKAVDAVPTIAAADTVAGGVAGAESLAVGSTADVVIETLGDHDWYAVTLTAGTTYTIHTTFDTTTTDAYLR